MRHNVPTYLELPIGYEIIGRYVPTYLPMYLGTYAGTYLNTYISRQVYGPTNLHNTYS